MATFNMSSLKSGGLKVNYSPANYSPAPAKKVLGASTSSQGFIGPTRPAGYSAPVQGGVAPVQSGGQQQQGQMSQQSVYEPTPQQPSIDFDALIAPALQGLEGLIAPTQQQSQANIAGLETSRANNVQRTTADIAGQQATLGQARTSQQQNAESASNEARRQYSEIQQGLQARYGGTTGTGAFATEIAGSQTLKNIGAVRQQLSSAMLEIDTKSQQVQEIGRIALQDIEDQTRDQISKEKANLESTLADIRRQKGELQSRKAELASQAIQMYQNTVSEVNARNAQFKQQLFMQQQSAEQQLKLAGQKAREVAQSYSVKDLNTLVENAQPLVKGGFNPTFEGQLQGGGRFQLNPKKTGDLANPNSTGDPELDALLGIK